MPPLFPSRFSFLPSLALLLLLIGALNVRAQLVVVSEDFDGTGAERGVLSGRGGGSGWVGGWGSSKSLSSYDAINVSKSRTEGYTNSGGSSESDGSATTYSSEINTLFRTFGSSPVSGIVWISFTCYSSSTNSLGDIIMFGLEGENGNRFAVGMKMGEFGVFKGSELVGKAGEPFPGGGNGNLVLVKIDTASGNVSAWLNPSRAQTEELMGEDGGHASAKIDLGGAIKPAVSLILRENTNLRVSLDAIRIAYGGSSEEAFQAVTRGAGTP